MKKKYFEELMKLADLEHHDIIDRSFLPSHAVIPKTSTMRSQGHDDWANNVILLSHENCPELSQYTNKKIIDNVVAANENPEINDEAGVGESEAIIAVTNDDATNILASLII